MIRRALFGTYTYLEFGVIMCAWVPIMGVVRLASRKDPTHRLTGRWLRRLGRTTARLTPLWRFSVEGEAPPDIDHRAYVVVSNHESNADPFLLSSLPWDMRWIAKEELFKPPVVGWIMQLSGDISLRRGEGDSVRAMFEECARTLEGGMSVMIFPEGTRSKTGELLPFKDGAFKMAIAAGVPILPIALAGTRNCLPKGSPFFGEADAVARVLAPIETTGLTEKDVPLLRDRVRDIISAQVIELRETLASR